MPIVRMIMPSIIALLCFVLWFFFFLFPRHCLLMASLCACQMSVSHNPLLLFPFPVTMETNRQTVPSRQHQSKQLLDQRRKRGGGEAKGLGVWGLGRKGGGCCQWTNKDRVDVIEPPQKIVPWWIFHKYLSVLFIYCLFIYPSSIICLIYLISLSLSLSLFSLNLYFSYLLLNAWMANYPNYSFISNIEMTTLYATLISTSPTSNSYSSYVTHFIHRFRVL